MPGPSPQTASGASPKPGAGRAGPGAGGPNVRNRKPGGRYNTFYLKIKLNKN